MGDREPMRFREWDAYVKHREIMVSSIVLKSSGWNGWHPGHAKLLGVLLWDYEGKRANGFRYREVLKRYGYGRTHNYRLLGDLVGNAVLEKQGRGVYRLQDGRLEAAEKAITVLRLADKICNEEKGNCPINNGTIFYKPNRDNRSCTSFSKEVRVLSRKRRKKAIR